MPAHLFHGGNQSFRSQNSKMLATHLLNSDPASHGSKPGKMRARPRSNASVNATADAGEQTICDLIVDTKPGTWQPGHGNRDMPSGTCQAMAGGLSTLSCGADEEEVSAAGAVAIVAATLTHLLLGKVVAKVANQA